MIRPDILTSILLIWLEVEILSISIGMWVFVYKVNPFKGLTRAVKEDFLTIISTLRLLRPKYDVGDIITYKGKIPFGHVKAEFYIKNINGNYYKCIKVSGLMSDWPKFFNGKYFHYKYQNDFELKATYLFKK